MPPRRFVPRPDIHARFVQICNLEDAKYAEHLQRLTARPVPRGNRTLRGALGRRRPEAEPEEQAS